MPSKTASLKTIDACMQFAIQNVVRFGDTDIFPYPIERQIVRDCEKDVLKLLEVIWKDFEKMPIDMAIEHERLLQAVGYTGFRQGTQIDTTWNIYLLGLVLNIGEDIEKSRIPQEDSIVFSYRFSPDNKEKTIFSKDSGWVSFQKRALELAQENEYVLVCDISDFYPRIYHHRLENALKKATTKSKVIKQIKWILSDLSKGVSYGLPVGGPAARLLSELLLNRVDRLMRQEKITYCRFVDDYYVFASSKEEAYAYLVNICEMLLENEGLTLQKTKTRIMSKAEFLESSTFNDDKEPDNPEELARQNFLRLHIHFDPYSATAEEDYEALKKELSKFDIVGMLAKEMRKTRISEGLTRKLIKAIGFLPNKPRDGAVASLVENLHSLYPVFPTVMLVIRGILKDLSDATRETVFHNIRELISSDSYLISVPVNLSFAIRVLAEDDSEETDSVLIGVYKKTPYMSVKRDVILTLAKHNADYWISDKLKKFNSLTLWERRALIIASYILEDEGSYWRDRIKSSLQPFDKIVMQWAATQKQKRSPIDLV